MATKIFVNLPVKDLNKSLEFFTELGFRNNPQFTDETAACMVITDDIYVMLLTHKKYKEFIKKEIADASKNSEVILALAVDSKEKVHEMFNKAIAAGGTEPIALPELDFMVQRSFQDLDGHLWEVLYMDESKMPKT